MFWLSRYRGLSQKNPVIPLLKEVYKNNPEEFKASDNLIKDQAIITELLSLGSREVVEHIGVSLVEFKEHTDVTFPVIMKENLDELIVKLNEKPFEVYTEQLLHKET